MPGAKIPPRSFRRLLFPLPQSYGPETIQVRQPREFQDIAVSCTANLRPRAATIPQVRQLRERLDRLNLDMIKICSDGNCQVSDHGAGGGGGMVGIFFWNEGNY